MVSLNVDEYKQEKRLGMDLIMVIDVSGSMNGEKIQLVKETLNFLVDELKDIDRLSFIVFDNKFQVLSHLSPMTEENKL